jgi:hypothetical protein
MQLRPDFAQSNPNHGMIQLDESATTMVFHFAEVLEDFQIE